MFAIFHSFSLWGFKTPATCFMFAGRTRKKMDVALHDWGIQMLARFFKCFSITGFFIYYICCLLYVLVRFTAQLVEDVPCKHWDLGSIPRSPHIIHSFCFNPFPCSVHPKVYHASSHVSLPSGLDHSSNGFRRKSRMYPSQPSYA